MYKPASVILRGGLIYGLLHISAFNLSHGQTPFRSQHGHGATNSPGEVTGPRRARPYDPSGSLRSRRNGGAPSSTAQQGEGVGAQGEFHGPHHSPPPFPSAGAAHHESASEALPHSPAFVMSDSQAAHIAFTVLRRMAGLGLRSVYITPEDVAEAGFLLTQSLPEILSIFLNSSRNGSLSAPGSLRRDPSSHF